MEIYSKASISVRGFLLLHQKFVEILKKKFVKEGRFFPNEVIRLDGGGLLQLSDSEKEFTRIDEYYYSEKGGMTIDLLLRDDKNAGLIKFSNKYNGKLGYHLKGRKPKKIKDVYKSLIRLRKSFITYQPPKIKVTKVEDWFYDIYCLCIYVHEVEFKDTRDYFTELESIYGVTRSGNHKENISNVQNNPKTNSGSNNNEYYPELTSWEQGFDNYGTGINYSVFYFSKKRNTADKFNLKIFYTKKPSYQTERQEYLVIEQGFDKDKSNPLYDGYAFKMKPDSLRLHIVLQNKKRDKKIKLILNCGSNPEATDSLFGSLMAVSADTSKRLILSYEVLAVKKAVLDLNKNLEILIRRYFNGTRKHIIVNTESSLRKLKIKQNDVNLYSWLVGYWKIWRFDANYEKIIQSVMYIRNDYRIYCITKQFEDKESNVQLCLLDVNQANRIIISCMSYSGDKIVTNMFLDNLEEGNPEVLGRLITVGKNYSPPRPRAFAMLKEDDQWFEYFNDSDDKIIENPKTEELINMLSPISREHFEGAKLNNPQIYELLKHSINKMNRPPEWFF